MWATRTQSLHPWWGYPSKAEFQAGMTCHGETNVVRWHEELCEPDRLEISAKLPESGLRVLRFLRCNGPALHFETTVENLTAWDRPIAWCEHVTLGTPVLSARETGFFAHLTTGFRTSHDSSDSFSWPQGRGQLELDLSRFHGAQHRDLVNSFLVDTREQHACFAAWNASLGLVFGYAFRADEFPWMNVWENNDSRSTARGMEFSTTPVEGSLKALFAMPTVYGTPTFEWLDAKGQIRKRFFSFSIEVPNDFAGVESITYDGTILRLVERGTPRKYELRIL